MKKKILTSIVVFLLIVLPGTFILSLIVAGILKWIVGDLKCYF